MTTIIHAYSSCVAYGTKLQAVLRHPDGSEQIVNDDIQGHHVVAHYLTNACELVFREVKAADPQPEPQQEPA